METRHTKAELTNEIETAWARLNDALNRLSDTQMNEVRDDANWAIKDHVVHMAAWARAVVYFLQAQPRHEGLGIDKSLYLAGDEDAINAAIQEQRKVISAAEALSELRAVHTQLLRLIEPMNDDDLYKPNSYFQHDASEERDERPVIGMIYGNTANHYREHQQWIESLVAQG